jgi:pyridinium-3,5-bisthiocarboxylic acid mononucleotide nickel chelatase
MTIAWIECFDGATADMFLGAWFELGVDQKTWMEQMSNLGVKVEDIQIETVVSKGVRTTRVRIPSLLHLQNLTLSELEAFIERSSLPALVKEKSKQVFSNLAQAEDIVRGNTTEPIFLNQLGFVDSAVSVIGNIVAWNMLGNPQCVVSYIQVGGGVLVPAPATVQLLMGFPTISSAALGETISQTAAALIYTLAVPASQRLFTAEKVGYGSSTDGAGVSKCIRIQLGKWTIADEAEQPKDETLVIETNIDDMSPEWAGHLVDRFLAKGAMDAYWIPIYMKKGRPALQLRVVCSSQKLSIIQQEIVRETTTIGMRIYKTGKWKVPHTIVNVQTTLGEFPVKIAYLDGEAVNIAPEYENCRKVAEQIDMSVKQVYQQVLAEAVKQYGGAVKRGNILVN